MGLGLALFLLSTPLGRRQLASPWPYVAGLVVLAVSSPVLVWNAQHDWISFAFQSGRGAPRRLAPLSVVIGLIGQIALLAPWVAVPLAWAGWRAIKAGPGQARSWFCLMAAAPTIVLFTALPLFGSKVLPHWPMPGWLMLFPVLGQALADSNRAWPARWAAASTVLLLLIWGLAGSDAATGWAKAALPRVFPKADPTAEAMDWSGLRAALAQRRLLHPAGQFVVSAEWNEAGKIDQALGGDMPVLVFSPDPREYAFRTGGRMFLGHDALIIGRDNTVREQLPLIAPHFAALTPAGEVVLGRGGQAELSLTVIVAHDLLTPYPLPAWAKGGR